MHVLPPVSCFYFFLTLSFQLKVVISSQDIECLKKRAIILSVRGYEWFLEITPPPPLQ